jgi:CRP-like cAMP-binding protein
MSRPVPAFTSPNRLLSAMAPGDLALLRPHLRPKSFEFRCSFARPGKPIDEVCFLETGIASTVAANSLAGAADDIYRGTEIGMTGNEGLTGWPVILESEHSPYHCYAQGAGRGLGINAAVLRRSMQSSPSLRRLLLSYIHVVLLQTAATALVNARGSLEQRVARWLLMAHDRLGGGELSLTHQFLAMMLGVRRAGVTMTLQDLERNSMLDRRRGKVVVVDRQGLERLAGDSYGMPEAEYRRLIG